MKITLEIQRFNPEKERTPEFKTYEVDVQPTDRILDALMKVKRFQDGTLSFRKSCAHGVCGSDAMRINGQERLACKTLVRDVAGSDGATVKIEPLRGFPVQRDLMVNHETFFKKYRSVKPFLINDEPVEGKERLQSQEERKLFDNATSCVLCSACFSACPVMGENPDFLGPGAIVQASRFLDDSRDKGFEPRLSVLDSPDGVWPCQNHFECTRVCPRSIKVTKRINLTKRKISSYREKRGEKAQDGVPS
jgi:succinate dehydrogenase / fumarate reductase iron-sulfur subunit